jgi:undecaprenyl-phosphate galactose phosphotransferase
MTKENVCIFYHNPEELEFIHLSQMINEYNVENIFIENENMIKDLLRERKNTIFLSTSPKIIEEHKEIKSYKEFLEEKIRAIYLGEQLNIVFKEGKISYLFQRSFDVILSFFLLIITFPICLIVALFIKFDIGFLRAIKSPKLFFKNSIFFSQDRIGKNRKIIKILKFRSMIEHNPEEYSKYSSEDDVRITKVGNFIRKTRIDEIPQIINILKGEMSFIGPRPEWDILGKEYEKQVPNYNLRYQVLPGLTGWAQVQYVYGNGVDDAKIKLEYELYYIKHCSLLLKIEIILKTIKVVFLKKGL